MIVGYPILVKGVYRMIRKRSPGNIVVDVRVVLVGRKRKNERIRNRILQIRKNDGIVKIDIIHINIIAIVMWTVTI
jgi:hypothetical protein